MAIWKTDEHGEQKMKRALLCRIYHEREWKDGGVVFCSGFDVGDFHTRAVDRPESRMSPRPE
jgi:hypothetical protein